MSDVDTSIPTTPTGPAAATAASHSAPSRLRLYGAWFCPFVQRAWIVLVEKSIPHQYIEVNPYLKPDSLLALNPRGLVPTLGLPGASPGSSDRALYESLVICEYLDDAYPAPGGTAAASPPLLPRGDPFEKARCRLWIDHISTRVVPSFYRLLQHNPTRSTYTLPDARADLASHLEALVRAMDPAGPWFLASGFSLVDVALAPWAMRLFVIDRYKDGGAGIPLAGEEGEEWAGSVWERWGRWFEAVRGRRSVRETMSDDEEYVKVYQRYADDTTQSLVGKATREGRGLP